MVSATDGTIHHATDAHGRRLSVGTPWQLGTAQYFVARRTVGTAIARADARVILRSVFRLRRRMVSLTFGACFNAVAR